MDNEQRLIAGCKRGESWAQKEVYEKYSPAMLALCVRYVSDYESAKDILQEGFIKLFTKIEQYEGRGSFGGWIRKIFVNTALEELANNKMLNPYVSMERLPDYPDDIDLYQIEQVSANDLLECIKELPSRSRVIFNMYAIEGYTHAEIAQKLGIKENSSRAQFSRARKFLQESVLKLMKT